MTYDNHEPERSTQDVPFELAQDRIAGLRASASPPFRTHPSPDRGPLDRGRDAVGRWLISLGAALVVDEGLRRRSLRP